MYARPKLTNCGFKRRYAKKYATLPVRSKRTNSLVTMRVWLYLCLSLQVVPGESHSCSGLLGYTPGRTLRVTEPYPTMNATSSLSRPTTTSHSARLLLPFMCQSPSWFFFTGASGERLRSGKRTCPTYRRARRTAASAPTPGTNGYTIITLCILILYWRICRETQER